MNIKSTSKALLLSLSFAHLTYANTGMIEMPAQLPSCPAEYLTDSLVASDGTIWVTSEGKGVYRLDPSNGKQQDKDNWFDVSYYQGMPDTANYYAIAEDKQGRIWVGTDNKGVAVFNGEEWKTYDRGNTLLGERIFDIAVSPATGDVAIATSGGVNIYQPQTQNWFNMTCAEGLVEDQVETLAYDGKGHLWLGYQCGGVSQLSEKDRYCVVKTDQAPWYRDKDSRVRQPMDGAGNGLPSNLCNIIYPAKNNTILLGTSSGLALKLGNSNWKYVRGQDYRAKNKGLWNIKVNKSVEAKTAPVLLPEDYITCLAETDEGLWVGFRQQGAVLLNPGTLKIIREGKIPDKTKKPFITTLLTLPGGSVYAGTYGNGLIKLNEGKDKRQFKISDRTEHSKHPAVPPIKKIEDINVEVNAMEKKAHSGETGNKPPVALFWKEDWVTQGNWCERYGKVFASLFGGRGTSSAWFMSEVDFGEESRIGGHKKEGQRLSVRSNSTSSVDNPNVLYDPGVGARYTSETTDNGEEYERYHDGPDIWVGVDSLPPGGTFEIALYFYNYEGHNLDYGAIRDYVVELRRYESELPIPLRYRLKTIDDYEGKYEQDCREKETIKILQSPVLARTRVKSFSGSGVYKSFIIDEPGNYYFRIANNYSSDSIVNGIFVTKLETYGGIPSETQERPTIHLEKISSQPPLITEVDNTKYENAINMAEQIMSPVFSKESLSRSNRILLDLYRTIAHNAPGASVIENWKWVLRLWNNKNQEDFEKTMLKSWYALQDKNSNYRSADSFPGSPRTIPFSRKECEMMERMGVDWKTYLPESTVIPKFSPEELKEKISNIPSKKNSKNKQ